MFACQKLARTAPALLKPFESQTRTFLSTPPRVRISLTEKLLLGGAFYVGVMTFPLWVIFNVRNYNAKTSE